MDLNDWTYDREMKAPTNTAPKVPGTEMIGEKEGKPPRVSDIARKREDSRILERSLGRTIYHLWSEHLLRRVECLAVRRGWR